MNTDTVIFKVESSEKKSGVKNGREWFAKNVWGKIQEDSPFKSHLKVNVMAFGKGTEYPAGFEVGDRVVMDIDELKIGKRKINLSGEVLPQ